MTRNLLLFASALFLLRFITSTEVRGNEIEKEDAGNENINAILQEIMAKCNETNKIDIAYIESLNSTGSFPDETNKPAKCFMQCMLKEIGIITNEDTFDAKKTALVLGVSRGGDLPIADLEQMAASCSDRNESCKCEKSYQYIKCFMEKEIKKYEEQEEDDSKK